MSEMLERVALAVSGPLANMTGGCFKPDNGRSERGECADGDCYCARVTRHVARAAIEAMREPTEAMLLAAGKSPDGVSPRGGVDYLGRMLPRYWQAMLTAALSDQLPNRIDDAAGEGSHGGGV